MEPIRFRCPDCQQALRVSADKAGRQVRCKRCGKELEVPASAVEEREEPAEERTRTLAPPPTLEEIEDGPDDETERLPDRPRSDRKPKRARRAEAWRWPRIGLLILMIGAALGLFNQLAGQFGITFFGPGGKAITMEGLRTFFLVTTVTTIAHALVKIIGLSLCLFAPRDSDIRPQVILALAAVVLTNLMTAWMFSGLAFDTTPALPDFKNVDSKDKAAREKAMRDLEEYTKKSQANLKGIMARAAIMKTVGTLLHALYIISVPLLLAAFCRALNLSELEPYSDALLKVSVGLIALSLVGQVLFSFLLVFLLGPYTLLSTLLSLIWEGLALALMFLIWQKAPAPR